MAEVDFGKYKLLTFSGSAIGAQAWSNTHVSGGGVSTDSQGHVSGGSVSSRVYERSRFFLKAADGREEEVTITDGFGVRDGQALTMVYASKKKVKDYKGYKAVYCYNHTTGHYHAWQSSVDALTGMGAGFDTLLGFIVAGLSGWLSYTYEFDVIGWWCLAVGPVAGILFYRLFLERPKRNAGKRLLRKAADLIAAK